jgi:hypothetical protein
MTKYHIVGIQEPGKVNTLFKGSFRDVCLFNLSQEDLAELFNTGCPFVKIMPADGDSLSPKVIVVKNKTKTKKPDKRKSDDITPDRQHTPFSDSDPDAE